MENEIEMPDSVIVAGEPLEEYLEFADKAMEMHDILEEEYGHLDEKQIVDLANDRTAYGRYAWLKEERDAYQTIALARLMRYYPFMYSGKYRILVKDGVYRLYKIKMPPLFKALEEFGMSLLQDQQEPEDDSK